MWAGGQRGRVCDGGAHARGQAPLALRLTAGPENKKTHTTALPSTKVRGTGSLAPRSGHARIQTTLPAIHHFENTILQRHNFVAQASGPWDRPALPMWVNSFVVAAVALVSTSCQGAIVVQTKYGPVAGSGSLDGIASFLGVPYAAPPGRWRPPTAPTPWTSPVAATSQPQPCLQPAFNGSGTMGRWVGQVQTEGLGSGVPTRFTPPPSPRLKAAAC